MKANNFLSDHQKAKTTALLLLLAAVVLQSAGVLCSMLIGVHTPVVNVLFLIGMVVCLALAVFTMHYTRHNEADRASGKQMAVVPHLYAVGVIFTASSLFVGGFGSFSYGVVHAILDCLLVALLVKCAGTLFGKMFRTVTIIASFTAFVLSLLEINAALNALLILCAVVLLVAALMCWVRAREYAVSTILFALVVIGFAVSAFFLNGDHAHMLLHCAVLCAGGVLLVGFVCALSPAVSTVRAMQDTQPAPVEEIAAPAPAITEKPATKKTAATKPAADKAPEQNTVLDRNKWIIKKYQSLSAAELLDAPVDALYGVSAGDAALLKSAFNIQTIGDLANSKYFVWAQEIVDTADAEK